MKLKIWNLQSSTHRLSIHQCTHKINIIYVELLWQYFKSTLQAKTHCCAQKQ